MPDLQMSCNDFTYRYDGSPDNGRHGDMPYWRHAFSFAYHHADTYDCIIATGLIAPGHAKEDCIPEMIRLVKPGECM